MSMNWRFPPLSGGNEQGYTNSGIETFRGEELIDNLAREICQNSLDAKDKSNDLPVEVNFELRHIPKTDHNVFSDFADCIKGCRSYWQQEMDEKLSSFITRAENALENDNIPVLVVCDYNTTGLTGSKTSGKSAWKALTHSDGTSLKNDAGSGGSYGIGKNAPFACSDLSMVFYNTYAIDDEKAFKGVSRLATILDADGRSTQGVGHYQNNNEEDETWLPIYGEDISPFRDLFARNKYGTDIIVVGFNESEDWEQKIEKAIINHFFPAIYEGKLVVRVSDTVIDAAKINEKIKTEFADDKGFKITGQLFEAMLNPDKKVALSILDDNDAELYIKSDSGYGRTIANFRATGMLVGKYSRRILQHYAAVLIVRGEALNELLKCTEPPKHNRWDYKLVDDKDKRKRARAVIVQIESDIIRLLREQYETVSESVIDSDTGEFIPDDSEDVGENAVGDDVLRVKQQLGTIRKKETKPSESTEAAKKDIGEDEGDVDVNNKKRHPNPKPMPMKPRVEPTEDGEIGITPGRGAKTIPSINILKQKVYPLNYESGLYKAMIIPKGNYSNVIISFSALGEDGSTDKLRIESYTISGTKSKSNDGKIRINHLFENTLSEIAVCFESKEKMVLRMNVEGGIAAV